jgi:uncharacterized protein (DUF1501 family)
MCNSHSKNISKEEQHDLEHNFWSRRSFLQALGITGAGTMMLGGNMMSASSLSPLSMAINNAETDNILILIRLNGGNDGLNTIIPLNQFDVYANNRPSIYIPESKVIKLNDEFGMAGYMKNLEPLWGEGAMKVVHGTGYPEQNLSHFTSSDIWASTENLQRIRTGWMGRYFEDIYPDYLVEPPAIPAAIQIGSFGNLIFEGTQTNYAFTTANPNQLERIAELGLVYDVENMPDCMYGDQLRFLRGTTNTTYKYSGVIHDAYERGTNDVEYDDNGFAKQLAILARLIKGNLGTRVYMVSMGGFDTHANQPINHERLMSRLSLAVNNFYEDLGFQDMQNKVLSMTFSEFGRRVFENGSLGTDHGASAPTLFFGPALNGSALVGEHPSLTDLERGNLKFTTDFRDLYGTVMNKWLCIDQQMVEEYLLGRPLQLVDLGFDCNGITNPPDDDPPLVVIEGFDHKPVYAEGEDVAVYIEIPEAGLLDIQLYDILGQRIGTIKNEMMIEGSYTIPIKQNMGTRLSTGQYIYRITYKDKKYSKSVLIRS